MIQLNVTFCYQAPHKPIYQVRWVWGKKMLASATSAAPVGWKHRYRDDAQIEIVRLPI